MSKGAFSEVYSCVRQCPGILVSCGLCVYNSKQQHVRGKRASSQLSFAAVLQAKRKYLDPEEVPEWMRFNKKELEEKQKREAEERRKQRKKQHKAGSGSSSSSSGSSSDASSSGTTSSSTSGGTWFVSRIHIAEVCWSLGSMLCLRAGPRRIVKACILCRQISKLERQANCHADLWATSVTSMGMHVCCRFAEL